MTKQFGSTVGKGTVLLVDDDVVNQLVMGRYLRSVGFDVATANHGIEALQILGTKAVDIILLDIQMPEMDGYETSRNIRLSDDDRIRNLPIIACTGTSEDEIRSNCIAFGINDYVIKPYSTEQILNKINQLASLWAIPRGTK